MNVDLSYIWSRYVTHWPPVRVPLLRRTGRRLYVRGVSDFALGIDGDLEVTLGRLRVCTGTEALAQRLRIRLKLFRGDWFLNVLEGVPYHDYVLRKRTSPAVRREVFRRAIVTMRGVKQLVSLEVSLDRRARTLTVTGEVLADDLSTVPFAVNPPMLDFPALPAEGAAS